MPSAISKLDNLSENMRRDLFRSIGNQIRLEGKQIRHRGRNAGAAGETVWNIPNSSEVSRNLRTYGLPKKRPQIWVAQTEFPTEDSTRYAILVAVAKTQQLGEDVAIAFEFNIDKKPNRNRMNFRFEENRSGIEVRCCGSFHHRRGRTKAELFYEFLDGIDHDLEIKPVDRKRKYVVLFRLLDGPDVSRQWREVRTKLARFADIITCFKQWLDLRDQS